MVVMGPWWVALSDNTLCLPPVSLCVVRGRGRRRWHDYDSNTWHGEGIVLRGRWGQGASRQKLTPKGAALSLTLSTFPCSDLYGAICLLASKETVGP